ncbi:MAG: hypothetical protein K2J83_05885 [Clostridia bacterium]|nr:hypothetical protein [Clostridia bacterium]
MKKIITSLFVLCLTVICATVVLTGCGQSRDPNEIIGVYSLKQMEIAFNDNTKNVYNVDYENNESEMLKELSKIVSDNLNYRYVVEKSENYVFKKQVYDKQSGNYSTAEVKSTTAEWDKYNDMFILKGSNGGDWYYINSNESGYYYVGSTFNIVNTYFEVEQLRSFMKDNNIDYMSIRYVLEK